MSEREFSIKRTRHIRNIIIFDMPPVVDDGLHVTVAIHGKTEVFVMNQQEMRSLAKWLNENADRMTWPAAGEGERDE